MILYGSLASPYVRHCRIALEQSAVEWKFESTDYDGSAKGSPGQRVPYLQDGDLQLTDSSSIIMYVRSLTGADFIKTVAEMELYTMANTACDSTINLFLLERDGLTPENTPYLARQRSRVNTLLNALSKQKLSSSNFNDSEIRLACFLNWALFRNRFELSAQPELEEFLAQAKLWDVFAKTDPQLA